jgi:hypothetical protein
MGAGQSPGFLANRTGEDVGVVSGRSVSGEAPGKEPPAAGTRDQRGAKVGSVMWSPAGWCDRSSS